MRLRLDQLMKKKFDIKGEIYATTDPYLKPLLS